MEVFDYGKQQWVAGEAAKALRAAQISSELDLLATDGRAYLDFSGKPGVSVADAVQHLRAEYARLATSPTERG